MARRAGSRISLVIGTMVLSVALVTAFNYGSTGARTVTAAVVTDPNSFLAIEINNASPHKIWGTQDGTSGKISFAFDGDAGITGTGINPDSTYEFDSVINITNRQDSTVTVDITIGGTDAALCLVALTTTEDQSAATYTNNPTGISTAENVKIFLGLSVSGTAKNQGDSVACTITVTGA